MKKKVMVAGLGKSGISAAKLLLDVGSEVLLYDGNAQLDVENIIEKLHVEDRSKITTKTGDFWQRIWLGFIYVSSVQELILKHHLSR